MTDGEQEIIRLLTEIRDAQQEELAYRRRVVDESVALQRRGIGMQRVGLVIVAVFVVFFLVWVGMALSLG